MYAVAGNIIEGRGLPPAKVVIEDQDGNIAIRAAAFTYIIPQGIAWVEPSYLDQWNAAPAAHYMSGQARATKDGALIESKDGYPLVIAPDGTPAWEEAFYDALKAKGTTREQEWERLIDAGIRELLEACIEEQKGGNRPQI